MNSFEKLTEDIFKVKDFVDYFYVYDESSSSSSSSSSIICIPYHIDNDQVYTQFGYDQGADFVIVVKVKDYTPVKNQKVIYRQKTYRVISWQTDGYNLMNNILLKSVTSK